MDISQLKTQIQARLDMNNNENLFFQNCLDLITGIYNGKLPALEAANAAIVQKDDLISFKDETINGLISDNDKLKAENDTLKASLNPNEEIIAV